LQQHVNQFFSQTISQVKDQKFGTNPTRLVGDFLFENERLLEHSIYFNKSFSVSLDTSLDDI